MTNDNELPSSGDSSALDWEEAIERYRRLAEKTQNPMYAWLALRARFRSRLGVIPSTPVGEEFSIPGWVADYLLGVTEQLELLSSGLDPRKLAAAHGGAVDPSKPAPASSGSFDPRQYSSIMELVQAPEWKAHTASMKISYAQAMTQVPAALGFTRDGAWNAFASLEATTSKMQEATFYDAARLQSIPSKVALHAIGDAIGVKDPSHLYTRLREGRDLRDHKEVGEADE